MANAKECDRCGELYKHSPLGACYIVNYKYLEPQTYDLCPKCYSSFTQWLNKHKQKEEDNAG
jgi:hypothetical protein